MAFLIERPPLYRPKYRLSPIVLSILVSRTRVGRLRLQSYAEIHPVLIRPWARVHSKPTFLQQVFQRFVRGVCA